MMLMLCCVYSQTSSEIKFLPKSRNCSSSEFDAINKLVASKIPELKGSKLINWSW
jgi:hypothetical protein